MLLYILCSELPNRPAVVPPGGGAKKQSTGSGPGIGISLGDLSKVRLKKVHSEEKKEPSEGSDGSAGSAGSQVKVAESDSFQGRMNMFKQAEGEGVL